MEISSILKTDETVLDKTCLIKKYMEMRCKKCRDIVYVQT